MKVFQKGFNYSQDGQGNRLVYHLQGCNMNCPWCSNPEGMAVNGERFTKSATNGSSLSCIEMSLDEMVDEAVRSSLLFYDGGGVTLTGGEAFVQFEEVAELLKKLKSVGIHTAVETNGTHKRLSEAFPYIDQLIMDCKSCDSKRHQQVTGIGNEQILKNLKLAALTHPCLHIRVPLVGGFNNRKLDVAWFLKLFQTLGGPTVTFEVLPYHEYGKEKWEKCGKLYEMTEEAYVTSVETSHFKSRILDLGLRYQST